MHPMKKESDAGANAKLERMTRDYGAADPKANLLAPVDRMKAEGPEDAVGFGADSDMPRARADRGARRKAPQANPVATYAKGGKVCRADGGDVSPIEQANREQSQTSQRARGGRTKKGSTHVNVIVAPGGGPGAGAMPPPVIPPGGPAVPPAAPMMAPKPPMGGMPPGAMVPPPGAIPPGAMPPRASGGRVHSDEAQDRKLFNKMFKDREKGEEHAKRAAGGKVHMTAGAESGPGRLEKTEIQARANKKYHPQAV